MKTRNKTNRLEKILGFCMSYIIWENYLLVIIAIVYFLIVHEPKRRYKKNPREICSLFFAWHLVFFFIIKFTSFISLQSPRDFLPDQLSCFFIIIIFFRLFFIFCCFPPELMNSPLFNYKFILIIHGWAVVMAARRDLLLLLVFLEIATWAMLLWMSTIGYQPERQRALQTIFILSLFIVLPAFLFFFSQYSSDSPGERSRIFKTLLLFMIPVIKIPIMGLHVWLPKAHVESNVLGSIVLASLFLKIGVYVLIRVFTQYGITNCLVFIALPLSFIAIGPLYVTTQTDFKRIIALSSVVHINIPLVLIPTTSELMFQAVIIASISHTIVSASLFVLRHYVSDNTGTRNVILIHSMATENSLHRFFFFTYFLLNITLPLTLIYYAEIITLSILPALNISPILLYAIIGAIFIFFFNAIQLNKVNYFKAKKLSYVDRMVHFYLCSIGNLVLVISLVLIFRTVA